MVNGGGDDGDGDSSSSTVVSFCPDRCSCNITISNQLQVGPLNVEIIVFYSTWNYCTTFLSQVICDSHFNHDFPISTLRKDVEILKIVPKYGNNFFL